MTREEFWFFTGKYFGYPECCIQDFLKRTRKITLLTPDQERVHNGHGFVPCPQCAAKVKDSAELIVDRKCTTPFPDSGTDKERYTWVFLRNFQLN